MSDSDGIRRMPLDEIHLLAGVTPKTDDVFRQLLQEALEAKLPVYFAAVPLARCVPFDLDYRPDRHPVGQQAIQEAFERGRKQTPPPMIVYPRGAWFVVSDHYIELFAALRGSPEYVPCWVLGKPETDFAQDVQGPIKPGDVRRVFGFD